MLMIELECLTILQKCKSKKIYISHVLLCNFKMYGNININPRKYKDTVYRRIVWRKQHRKHNNRKGCVLWMPVFFDFRKAKTQRYQHQSLNKRVACSVILELYLFFKDFLVLCNNLCFGFLRRSFNVIRFFLM